MPTPTDDARRDHDAPPTADGPRSDRDPPLAAAEERPLVALVDDAPDGRRCTVCPATADAADVVTTWLTVDESVVCDLEDWR